MNINDTKKFAIATSPPLPSLEIKKADEVIIK